MLQTHYMLPLHKYTVKIYHNSSQKIMRDDYDATVWNDWMQELQHQQVVGKCKVCAENQTLLSSLEAPVHENAKKHETNCFQQKYKTLQRKKTRKATYS